MDDQTVGLLAVMMVENLAEYTVDMMVALRADKMGDWLVEQSVDL